MTLMKTPRVPAGRNGSVEAEGSRKREILAIAARMFAARGYRGTSVRDIGMEAGILGGSLYHHIKSKDALFVELHDAALDGAAAAIARAVADAGDDPWERLRAAAITLLAIQLDPQSLTLPLMNDFRAVPEQARRQLIARRDAFEDQFRELVAALPLPGRIDRQLYRLLLLSQLNGAGDWYRPSRLTPAEIADQIVLIFRH